jgi:hypothetical protein
MVEKWFLVSAALIVLIFAITTFLTAPQLP